VKPLKHQENGRAGMRAGWEVKTLGEVLEIQNGYAFDSKCFNPTTGLPLIRIRSLKSGTETETYYNGNYDEKYVVHCGDLLIGMDGEFGCYEWKGEPALLNQRVCRLRNFSDDLDPKFLFYGVNTHLKAIEDVTGFATVKHLSSKQILSIEFPLPPLAEQQRIVAILDEAFEGIATARKHAEQNLQNAKTLFESHLEAVFSQKGEGWVEKPLKSLCNFSQGVQVDTKLQSEIQTNQNQIRFLRIVDFTQRNEPIRYIDFPGEKFYVCPSDVSLVRYGASTGFVCRGLEGAIANNLFRVIPVDNSVSNDFLYWFLRSNAFQNIIKFKMIGTAMPAISFGMIGEIVVPIPPTEDQPAIVIDLDALRDETNRLCDIYTQKIAALDALKKSLLHQAFSGEL
jgi:type I restriction enzyme S subunit